MSLLESFHLDLLEKILIPLSIVLHFYARRQEIVGERGTVLKRSDPSALIRVEGGKWPALAENGAPLEEGDAVVVSRVSGLQLAIVSQASADFSETSSPRTLSSASRLEAGVFAAWGIVEGLKQGAQGEGTLSAVYFSLAVPFVLSACGVLKSKQGRLQTYFIVSALVYAVFWFMGFLTSS